MRSIAVGASDRVRDGFSAAASDRLDGFAEQLLFTPDEFTVVLHLYFTDDRRLINRKLFVFRAFRVVVLLRRGKLFNKSKQFIDFC